MDTICILLKYKDKYLLRKNYKFLSFNMSFNINKKDTHIQEKIRSYVYDKTSIDITYNYIIEYDVPDNVSNNFRYFLVNLDFVSEYSEDFKWLRIQKIKISYNKLSKKEKFWLKYKLYNQEEIKKLEGIYELSKRLMELTEMMEIPYSVSSVIDFLELDK